MFFYKILLFYLLLSSGKANPPMKLLKFNTQGQIFLKIRSPEQFEDSDTTNEVLDFEEHKGGVAVSDDMPYPKQKSVDTFFTRGRQKDLKISFLYLLYCRLPKRTMRSNSNIIVLF